VSQEAATQPSASFREPRIWLPFLLITLIWGSTWIVIRDQISVVPPGWSVAYRFAIAGAAMFAFAAARGVPLRLDARGHLLALAFGVPQFCLNFNFVYIAERYITSGLVALVFALLMVPNALLARIFLGQKVGRRFVLGSAIALAGIALLFVQEVRADQSGLAAVLSGIALTLCGVMAASAANVSQAGPAMRARPLEAMIAWGMFYGLLADVAFAWAMHGPPAAEPRWGYWAGLLYLALVASSLAFLFYFRLVRLIGPGRSAYSSVLVPIIAMAFSTAFEGYAWTPLAIGGSVLALVGLVVALRARRI